MMLIFNTFLSLSLLNFLPSLKQDHCTDSRVSNQPRISEIWADKTQRTDSIDESATESNSPHADYLLQIVSLWQFLLVAGP